MRITRCHLLWLIVLALAGAARGQVLVREVISREISVETGGVDVAGSAVSREITMEVFTAPTVLASREMALIVTSPEPPPPVVDIVVQATPTGDSVTVNWSAYNQWQVRDVARFEIYLSDAPFTSIQGLTPILSVPAESISAVLSGLPQGRDHFIAIVAVDALGNLDPAVTYSAAYVLSPEAISREITISTGGHSDLANREAVSREVALAVVNAAPPAQVTNLIVTSTPTGDGATLNWSGYNQWAERDIVHFDIYVSDQPFSSVTGLSPTLVVPGEQTMAELTGLPSFQDHFFAIVAVDALGNANPAVLYSAAYILSPQVISREISVAVGDSPGTAIAQVNSREVTLVVADAAVPAPVTGPGSGFTAVTSASSYRAIDLDWTSYNELLQHDVVRYRIYLDTMFFTDVTGMTPFAFSVDGNKRMTIGELDGNEIYYVAVVAEDSSGTFNPAVLASSVQSSVNETWLPSQQSVRYNAAPLINGATIRAAGILQVEGAVALGITRVDFFVRGAAGGDALLASDTTPANGFTALWDAGAYFNGNYVFTIRAYDADQRLTEITRSINLLFNLPPAISGMTFNGAPLADGTSIAVSGKIGVQATDSDGVSLAEFLIRPAAGGDAALIGSDSSPSNGLETLLNAESIPDGEHDVIARVYDLLGSVAESSRRITVVLAPPAAPVIGAPADGLSVTSAVIEVQGTAPVGATLKLYRNGSAVFTGQTPASGAFSVQVALLDGANVIFAEAANRAGASPPSASVTVTKVLPPPVLTLAFPQSSLAEGAGMTGSVSVDRAPAQPLVVSLGVSQANRFAFPATVTIPSGQTSAPFVLNAVQNDAIEAAVAVTLIASAPGATAATFVVTAVDDDRPAIALAIQPSVASEAGGTQAVKGMLLLDRASAAGLFAKFAASSEGQVLLPSSVAVPANALAVPVPITILNNDAVDGERTVSITAQLFASPESVAIASADPADLLITDDDGPALSLTFDRSLLQENANPAANATVSRSLVTNRPVTVTLATSDPDEVIVPATVTIPANHASVEFTVATTPNATIAGSRPITIAAAAPGLSGATAGLTLTDLDAVDLAIEIVSTPAGAETEAWIDVRYALRNQGATDAIGPFAQRILLSRDPAPGDDTVLTVADFTGVLPAGASLEQTLRVRLPREAGRYWLVAEADAGGAIAEVLEDNNLAVASSPIDIEPAYSTTLQIVPATVPAGTAIPITGTATLRSGDPAAHVLVNIHITNGGIQRVISALTNALGRFSVAFTPLPGEGGLFQFGAAHPGLETAPIQDEVRVYGLRAEPAEVVLELPDAALVTGTVVITNLADLPVSGLSVGVAGLPAGVQFTPVLGSTSIASSGIVALDYSIAAPAPLEKTTFTVTVTSTEGAVASVPFTISAVANQPVIVAEPGELSGGMLRGRQQFITFQLRNAGPVATAAINLVLPSGAPWLRVATPLPLPPLQPEETVPVTLQLLPPADLPLAEYSGNLVASDGAASVLIPFHLLALSDETGALTVRVEDEYTYYAAGNPPLAGATVTVTDALTREHVGTLVTGASGTVDFGELREGYYEIDVTAHKHSSFRETHLVVPGTNNEVTAFITRQTVTYHWTVEPTQIEDRYKVTIDTIFETNVPLPVLTMEPAVIDLAEITADESFVNVTVTNHGLIAANATRLDYPTHPRWEFRPLVSDLGVLPAKSSVTVPVRIRRLPAAGIVAMNGGGGGGGGGACTVGASACATIVCGKYSVTICGGQALTNAATGCGFAPGPGDAGCPGCGVLFGGGVTSSGASASGKLVCDPDCLVLAALGCIPGPVGCFFSGYSCGGGLAAGVTPKSILDCAVGAAGCLVPGAGVPSCIYSLISCLGSPAGGGGGGGGPGGSPAASAMAGAMFAPAGAAVQAAFIADPIEQFTPAIRAMLDAFNEVTGAPDGVWINAQSGSGTGDWWTRFQFASAESSEAERSISAPERALLVSEGLPPGVPLAEVNRFLDRWNRTLVNWDAGLLSRADTPAGESTDFIDAETLRQLMLLCADYQEQAEMGGFTDPFNAIVETARFRSEAGANGGICGRIKLRLEQEAVLTRDAFRATLELDNSGASPLQNVKVELAVRSSSGAAAELFDIRLEGITGITAVDGTGQLAVSTSGSARWEIIPTIDAAPTEPVDYFVGGRLSYTVDGVDVSIPLAEARITVLPAPRLTLKYYHQRDVFSDDPFTDPVEPAIPYSLAVLVQNNGAGIARNFRITSAQPKIIENEKGLLADFKIIATEVAGQSLQPSLTADFGDIAAGEIKIAQWLMTSSIHGLFIDYEATFEHLDGRGNPRLSLIDGVEIYEMIRQVRALGALDDGKPDFLINGIPDIRDLPDTMHLSDGTTAPVAVIEQAQITGQAAQLSVTLTANLPAGWAYLRVPDPANGQYALVGVSRSDGVEIPIDVNAWVTDRTFLGQGRRPTYENILHLADFNSTGTYTLTYEAKLPPDTLPPSSFVKALPAQSPAEFEVSWEGSDNRLIGYFDVFVSIDNGAFEPWMERARGTSALFRGELGHAYAFYSQATDVAGNREVVSGAADASTVVSIANLPPAFAEIEDQEVDEGATFTFQLAATDPDGPSSQLRFSFTGPVPAGMTLDAQSGAVRWPTSESDGGKELTMMVAVTDRGAPAATTVRAFQLRVNEMNQSPRFGAIAAQTAKVGQQFSLQLPAEDFDSPAQALQFRLASGNPAGMMLNASSGLLTWTPPASFAEQSVPVAVIVADDTTAEGAATFLLTIEPATTAGPFTIKLPASPAPPVELAPVVFSADAAGTYAGLLIGGAPDPDLRAFMTAKIARSGSFTGSLRVGGTRATIRGKLDASGALQASATLPKGRTVAVDLELRRSIANGFKLVGAVNDSAAATEFAADLQRATRFSAKSPSPLAGPFTLLLPHPEDAPVADPEGHGFATVTVTKTGAVRAIGRLPDGTPFKQGGLTSRDSEWPFFTDLYAAKPRGFLAGPLRFRDVPAVSDLDGAFTWRRPQIAKSAAFRDGFTLIRNAIGSRYAKPARNTRALPGLQTSAGNAIFQIDAPAQPWNGNWDLIWDARNVFSAAGAHKVTGRVNARNGSFSGKFATTANAKPQFRFGGVVFQKQGIAGGSSANPAQPAAVLIRAE